MGDNSDSGGEQYHIEEILKRRVRKGKFEYFIKWEGYGSEDNTWEKREHLIEDGFEADVENYDEEVGPKNKRGRDSTRSGNRSRSKTPVRKPKKVEKEEEEEEDDDDDEEKPDDDEGQDADKEDGEEGEENDEEEEEDDEEDDDDEELSKQDIEENNNFIWTWLASFFVSTMMSVLVLGLKVQLTNKKSEREEYFLNIISLINDPLPMILCVRAIVKNGPSTDFTNFACIVIVWIGMTKFCESLQNVLEEGDNGYLTVLAAMGIWQVFTVLTLFVSPKAGTVSDIMGDDGAGQADNRTRAANMMTASTFIIILAVFYQLQQSVPLVQKLSMEELLVILVSCFAASRAWVSVFVCLLSQEAPPFYMWLELFGSILGTLYVAVAILKTYKEFPTPSSEIFSFPIGNTQNNGTIVLPIFEITHNIFAWATCCAFMCSAIMYHDEGI